MNISDLNYENKKFYTYYLSLYNNYLMFNAESPIEVMENIDFFTKRDYLESLSMKLQSIIEKPIYTDAAIKNIGCIIDLIKDKTDNRLMDLIEIQYKGVKRKIQTEDIYYKEAMTKFIDFHNLNSLLTLNKTAIEESIMFDYFTIYALINQDFELSESDYFIASLKKFIKEYPTMFYDKNINKRALDLLAVNKNNEESDRLSYKIKHIDKFYKDNYNVIDFVGLYDYVLIQNMLYDKEVLKEQSDLLDSSKMNTLYYIIESHLIDTEQMKRNAYDIMTTYKTNVIDKSSLEKKTIMLKDYNDSLGILNSMQSFHYEMTIRDYNLRFKYNYMKRFDLMKDLVKQDLQVLRYMIGESIMVKDSKELYSTFNKFLALKPCIFDNEIIYNKSMNLLCDDNFNTKITKSKVKKAFKR